MSSDANAVEFPTTRYRALFVAVAVGFLLVAGIVLVYFPQRERRAIESSMQLKALEGARLSALGVSPAVDFDDPELAAEVFARSRRDPELLWVAAYRADGTRYAADGPAPAQVPGEGEEVVLRDDGVFAITPIDLAEGRGHVATLYSTERVRVAAQESERVALTVAAIIFVIGLLLGVGVARTVQRQELLLIENRRARLAAEAASEARLAFLASVSHELRTPLNGVLGLSEALGLEFPDGRANWFSNAIRRSGGTLLALVNDVLDFSKAESGDLQLEEVPFSLESCIGQAVEVIAPAALSKRLDFVVDVDPGLPRTLVGDGLRIQQILSNLLSNATKFTHAGSIALTVNTRLEGDTCELLFAVRDTGIGMSKAQLEGIFDAFVQADASITRRFGGTGLGLAISKQLADQMGGSLEVESEPEVGTCFELKLALQVADPAPCATMALDALRVVLADTDPQRARALRRPLLAWGATVIDADVALRDPEAAHPDVLVITRHLDDAVDAVSQKLLDTFEEARALVFSPDPGTLEERQAWLPYPLRLSRLERVLSGSAEHVEEVGPPNASALGPIGGGSRLLVAEDHDTNRQVAQLLLSRLGFECDFAHDGAEALQRYKSNQEHHNDQDGHRYVAVLMDVQMPVMDGLSATREIRQWEAHTERPRVPIFGLSAHALAEEKANGIDAGMDLFLTKPVTLETLRRALEPCVDEQVVARARRQSGRAEVRGPSRDMAHPPRAAAPSEAEAGTVSLAGSTSHGAMPTRPPEEVLQQASVSMLLGLSDVRVTANIVSEFIDDTRARITLLRAAVQTEDRAEIGRIAHGIKGACWSLGLAALGDALQRIDAASRDPEQSVTLADMDAIEDEVERATDAMRWLLAVCAERAAEQR